MRGLLGMMALSRWKGIVLALGWLSIVCCGVPGVSAETPTPEPTPVSTLVPGPDYSAALTALYEQGAAWRDEDGRRFQTAVAWRAEDVARIGTATAVAGEQLAAAGTATAVALAGVVSANATGTAVVAPTSTALAVLAGYERLAAVQAPWQVGVLLACVVGIGIAGVLVQWSRM